MNRVLAKVFHAVLPKMSLLHRLIVRFLTGADNPYQNTWGRRIPGVSDWCPPLALQEG